MSKCLMSNWKGFLQLVWSKDRTCSVLSVAGLQAPTLTAEANVRLAVSGRSSASREEHCLQGGVEVARASRRYIF